MGHHNQSPGKVMVVAGAIVAVRQDTAAPSSTLRVSIANPGTQLLFKSQIGATGVCGLLVGVQAHQTDEAASQLPRWLMGACLERSEKRAL
jgi:hypothetical protein